jgi:toluene monooxygenase system ferredoxin subunit
MDYVRVSALDDLWSGEMQRYVVNGQAIVVVRHEDDVFAYEDRCPHLGLRLSDGTLVHQVLTCRGHLWQFNSCTGRGINPAAAMLTVVPVKICDGDILVAVEGRG